MYSLPLASVITAPSPEAITTSLSATTCMSAKPCQKRVGMARRLHVVTESGMAGADPARVHRARQLLAGRHGGQAGRPAEDPHLADRRLPAEIGPGPRRAEADPSEPATIRRR